MSFMVRKIIVDKICCGQYTL